jgi:hypothetical protein
MAMRAMMVFAAAMVVGCAGQPSSPPPATVAVVSAPSGDGSSAAAAPSDIESQRLASAKKRHLKLVNRDGQELFCQTNTPTGTKIPRDPICLTAEQLDKMERKAQNDFDQNVLRPAFSAPGKSP